MEQIIELLSILRNRPLLVPENSMGKKVAQLAKWIKSQEKPTDEQACQALAISSGSAEYRKIKYHLRLQLLNSITATSTSQTEGSESRSHANQQLWHQLAAIKAAPQLYSRHQGNRLANHISITARQHDLQDQLTLNMVFQSLYGEGCRPNANENPELNTVNELYNGFLRGVVRSSQTASTYMNKTRMPIEEKVSSLKTLLERYQRLDHHQYGHLAQSKAYIQMKIALYEGDLPSAKNIHDTRIKVLKAEKVVNIIAIRNLKLNLLRCYAKSAHLEEGLLLARSLQEKFQVNNIQGYGFLEILVLIAMKTGEFQLAITHYLETVNHPFFSEVSQNSKETLMIMEAYLSLLIKAGIVKETKASTQFNKLKIHRFLNNLIYSQKEKNFRNTHAIIIKVLDHCINRRDEDFNYSEAIKKYVQRHLQDPEHTRSKNFLLAIIQYPENGYNLKLTMKYAEKYLTRMLNAPQAKYSAHAYQEIIPYDKLWEIATTTKLSRQ